MNNVHIEGSDVVIKRVSNGWIVLTTSDADENFVMSHVFEDLDVFDFSVAAAGSLKHALFECFGDFMQSKRSAGLVIELKEKGWSNDD